MCFKNHLEKKLRVMGNEQLTIRLKSSSINQLDDMAARHKVSRNALIADCVLFALAFYDQEPNA